MRRCLPHHVTAVGALSILSYHIHIIAGMVVPFTSEFQYYQTHVSMSIRPMWQVAHDAIVQVMVPWWVHYPLLMHIEYSICILVLSQRNSFLETKLQTFKVFRMSKSLWISYVFKDLKHCEAFKTSKISRVYEIFKVFNNFKNFKHLNYLKQENY